MIFLAPEPVPIVDAEELRQFLSLVKSTTNDKSALLWAWKQTLRQRKEFMSAEGRTIKQILAEYPSLHANWGFELVNIRWFLLNFSVIYILRMSL